MGLVQLIFGDKSQERMKRIDVMREQGICIACGGSGMGFSRGSAWDTEICHACGGTGRINATEKKED